MPDQKHSNRTYMYTENTCVSFIWSLALQITSVLNVEPILGLLLMWKNVYSAWIVIQTQAF